MRFQPLALTTMAGGTSTPFLCPECGSRELARRIKYRRHPLPSAFEVMENPWLGIFESMVCAGCGFHIPSCYGELWDGLTPTRALAEWRCYYRDRARRERLKRSGFGQA